MKNALLVLSSALHAVVAPNFGREPDFCPAQPAHVGHFTRMKHANGSAILLTEPFARRVNLLTAGVSSNF